jgi:hypothetical protein
VHHEDEVEKSVASAPEDQLLQRVIWKWNCSCAAGPLLRSRTMKGHEFEKIRNLTRRIRQFLQFDRARYVDTSERGPERVQFVAGQWGHEEMGMEQESVIALPVLRFNAAEDKFGRRCSPPKPLRSPALHNQKVARRKPFARD